MNTSYVTPKTRGQSVQENSYQQVDRLKKKSRKVKMMRSSLILTLVLVYGLPLSSGNWLTKEAELVASELSATSASCNCAHYTCRCCLHMEVAEIELNSTVCLDLAYLNKDYGVSFILSLNKYTLYNETISVHNPPPMCESAPFIPELADLCIRLHDIDVSSVLFHTCVKIEARMKFIRVAQYELGCFTIGKHSSVSCASFSKEKVNTNLFFFFFVSCIVLNIHSWYIGT